MNIISKGKFIETIEDKPELKRKKQNYMGAIKDQCFNCKHYETASRRQGYCQIKSDIVKNVKTGKDVDIYMKTTGYFVCDDYEDK